MFRRRLHRVVILAGLSWTFWAAPVAAQLFNSSSPNESFAGLTTLNSLHAAKLDTTIFQFASPHTSALESRDGSVSRFDLKPPGHARDEFEQGYRSLLLKNFPAAIEHLSSAIAAYPTYVAAYNALGLAYLNSGEYQQAREQFARAIGLDAYVPASYLNLGCALLELKLYTDAEDALKQGTAIAVIDPQLLTALTYAAFQNQDYPTVIATARQVHRRAHVDFPTIHLLSAAAWEALHRYSEAQEEIQLLLVEQPKSPDSPQFRKILEQLKEEEGRRRRIKQAQADPFHPVYIPPPSPDEEDVVADLHHPSGDPKGVDTDPAPAPSTRDPGLARQVIRVAVEEVALLFSVTDGGKAVNGLRLSDIELRDDNQPPEAVLGFQNMTQLPLRMGLIIDTSASVTDRFLFEQGAASKFLETVVTDKNDMAFVIGANWSMLLVQDFTSDQSLTTHAVHQLAPGGGTALWDAVAFAADKLAANRETRPVARVLVVISDGEDNSSSVTLKQAVFAAQRDEVTVYTVSTKEGVSSDRNPLIGNHALKTLAESSGGSAFTPGSLSGLTKSLAELQEVLRGRYLVSYKPASSQPDGRYHAVDLRASKDGHHLKIYARKGYYASALFDAGP